MAGMGLSKPFYAIYKATGNTVEYSNGGLVGKAVSFSTQFNTANDSNLSADNGVAESEKSFTGGTITIATDDLTPEVSAAILGITAKPVGTIEGVTDENVQELVYDDEQEIPYLGFGVVEKKKYHGEYLWRGVVLTKVMFSVPADAAETQGKTVSWKTPTLTGEIMRDDSEAHKWKREATFTTEAQAEAYIKNRLNIV